MPARKDYTNVRRSESLERVKRVVLEEMKAIGRPITFAQVAHLPGCSRGDVWNALRSLRTDGTIERIQSDNATSWWLYRIVSKTTQVGE